MWYNIDVERNRKSSRCASETSRAKGDVDKRLNAETLLTTLYTIAYEVRLNRMAISNEI